MSQANPVSIIAEIGVNHNGCVDEAKKLVDKAKYCGATHVKFQLFNADRLVSKNTPKVPYQLQTTGQVETHYEMIKKLEFGKAEHQVIFDYCKKLDINFISTPYDVLSAMFLVEELKCNIIKTASADLVDYFLHSYLSKTDITIIIATGMATHDELQRTLSLYKNSRANIILLHCVSNYPCKQSSLNLRVISDMKKIYKKDVGFSDHSVGPSASTLAVALGATWIEKHFTLDKTADGPDHKASDEPEEFSLMVSNIRSAEVALGVNLKVCQDEEQDMRRISRKSLCSSRKILQGQVITPSDIVAKRPGTGFDTWSVNQIIGKRALVDIEEDTLFCESDFQ